MKTQPGKNSASIGSSSFPALRLIVLMLAGTVLLPARSAARPPLITTGDLQIDLARLPRIHRVDAVEQLRRQLASLPAGALRQRRGLSHAIALIRILRRNRLGSEPASTKPRVALLAEVTGNKAVSDYHPGR